MSDKKPKRNDVPSENHVARYCHPQRGVIRDAETGQIKGLFPAAFELRPRLNENYLSLNHFEHFGPNVDEQFRQLLVVMRSKFTRPPEPVVARLSAARVIACGLSCQRQLRLRCRGTRKDPSYVALEGLPLDNRDTILLTRLATEACVEIRSGPAIDAT